MRFKYSTNSPNQNEFDSLPRIPIILHKNNLSIETNGLVDSGATVNVLPYQLGIQLGEVWDNNQKVKGCCLFKIAITCSLVPI